MAGIFASSKNSSFSLKKRIFRSHQCEQLHFSSLLHMNCLIVNTFTLLCTMMECNKNNKCIGNGRNTATSKHTCIIFHLINNLGSHRFCASCKHNNLHKYYENLAVFDGNIPTQAKLRRRGCV